MSIKERNQEMKRVVVVQRISGDEELLKLCPDHWAGIHDLHNFYSFYGVYQDMCDLCALKTEFEASAVVISLSIPKGDLIVDVYTSDPGVLELGEAVMDKWTYIGPDKAPATFRLGVLESAAIQDGVKKIREGAGE